jgi:CRP/FNR family transcriptional regulator
VVHRLDVVACLARSYLFEGLSAADLAPLAATVSVQHLPRGSYIWHVGDPADEIIVIVAGEIKDTVVDVDGKETVHFVRGPGMTCGEPGFFAPEHDRVVDEVVVDATMLLRIHRRHLVPFMEQHPAVKDRALEGLAAYARWQATTIAFLTRWSVADRIGLRLLDLIDSGPRETDGPLMTPKISQSMLAAMVGVTRENANRGIATLVADGLVRHESGRYVILDEAALRQRVTSLPLGTLRDRRV